MKKGCLILALLLAVSALLVGVSAAEPSYPTTFWSDYASAKAPAYDADSKTYSVYTAAELSWVSKQVAGLSADFEGKTIKLMADLDLSSHQWVPIGIQSFPFKGSFDGNGKTIKGLTITALKVGDCAGLIGYAEGKNDFDASRLSAITIADSVIDVQNAFAAGLVCAYVSDYVNLSDCSVLTSSVSSDGYTGGVCGYSNRAISGCSVRGTDVVGSYAGGICGHAEYASIIAFCSANEVTVSSKEDYAGGLVGYATGQINNSTVSDSTIISTYHAGGLCGFADDPIRNCTVTDVNVTASVAAEGNRPYADFTYAGGLCGSVSWTNITNCRVIGGTVSASTVCRDTYYKGYAGGLCGRATQSNYTISDSAVIGLTILSTHEAGGLCGLLRHSAENVCVIDSEVSGSTANAVIGGLCGILESGALIKNAYADVTLSGTYSVVGHLVGNNSGAVVAFYNKEKNTALPLAGSGSGVVNATAKTLSEIKSKAFADALNAYWDEENLNKRIWKLDSDASSPSHSFPLPFVPTVEKVEMVKAPAFKGDSVTFRAIGQNLDNAQTLYFYDGKTQYPLDNSHAASLPTDTYWSKDNDCYYTSIWVDLYVNNVHAFNEAFRLTLPLEAPTPVVESLAVTSEGDNAYTVTISGRNLTGNASMIHVIANWVGRSETAQVSAVAKEESGVLKVTLHLPANADKAARAYQLSVAVAGKVQSTTGTTAIIQPASAPASRFDVNGDGVFSVTDILFLIRRLAEG